MNFILHANFRLKHYLESVKSRLLVLNSQANRSIIIIKDIYIEMGATIHMAQCYLIYIISDDFIINVDMSVITCMCTCGWMWSSWVSLVMFTVHSQIWWAFRVLGEDSADFDKWAVLVHRIGSRIKSAVLWALLVKLSCIREWKWKWGAFGCRCFFSPSLLSGASHAPGVISQVCACSVHLHIQ